MAARMADHRRKQFARRFGILAAALVVAAGALGTFALYRADQQPALAGSSSPSASVPAASGGPSPSTTMPAVSVGATASPATSATTVPVPVESQGHGTFQPTGSMADARERHTATLLLDGRVLVTGGIDVGAANTWEQNLASAELYDPSTGQFSVTGSMNESRRGHTATRLRDGRVLIAGGEGGSGAASAELYDPNTGKFGSPIQMTAPRFGHTATLLFDGRVLITGGRDPFEASAELFDPATDTFSATGSMAVPRALHTATRLADGRVLIAGGRNGNPSTNLVEIYDPATGTFSATGRMTQARDSHSATLLSNGRVLIAGGLYSHLDIDFWPQDPVSSAELYDPATGKFSATGSMSPIVGQNLAIRLADGRILFTSQDQNNGPRPAEVYSPATGKFVATGAMAEPSWSRTAAVLLDGRVLFVGGVFLSSGHPGRDAETYQP
jgi:hypothetical protein